MTLGSDSWKGQSTTKVPFGLKDGRLWFVSDVPVGLECGCRCPDPACDQPLIARNQASPDRRRAYYFAHAGASNACGGRESALHRMAKDILLQASTLRLPALALSPNDVVESTVVALSPESQAEVRLLDGQVRSDVSTWLALDDGTLLAPIHVEVRVSHAVDTAKQARVIAHGLTMVEIDLSQVNDAMVQDLETFSRLVLEDDSNRQWVNLGHAALLSALAGREIIEIDTVEVHERTVPFRAGDGHVLLSNQVVRSMVAGRDPWITEIELESYLGQPAGRKDATGKTLGYACSRIGPIEAPTDGRGTPLPYAPGLYERDFPANPHKTRLRLLTTRTVIPDVQGQLFVAP